MIIFVLEMSKRREKNKPQPALVYRNEQQKSNEPKRGKGETTIAVGKFLLDLAKLVFGGVILTVIVNTGDIMDTLVWSGLLAMFFFFALGVMLVKIGNNKKG